jgi:hypothetical protein
LKIIINFTATTLEISSRGFLIISSEIYDKIYLLYILSKQLKINQ